MLGPNCDLASVHPRRRGEHPVKHVRDTCDVGSSPQARGTPLARRQLFLRIRFIPAGAGNTRAFCVPSASRSVHPRRRGEHRGRNAWLCQHSGSSPQARGTRHTRARSQHIARFIPAGAGNTLAGRLHVVIKAVHPRRRGEHSNARAPPGYTDGSSPQARGTLRSTSADYQRERFIPAGAGNTIALDHPNCPPSVHPRRRGEHAPRFRETRIRHGSSPQARGTRRSQNSWVDISRFIPAGAGNTSSSPRRPIP